MLFSLDTTISATCRWFQHVHKRTPHIPAKLPEQFWNSDFFFFSTAQELRDTYDFLLLLSHNRKGTFSHDCIRSVRLRGVTQLQNAVFTRVQKWWVVKPATVSSVSHASPETITGCFCAWRTNTSNSSRNLPHPWISSSVSPGFVLDCVNSDRTSIIQVDRYTQIQSPQPKRENLKTARRSRVW